MKFNVHLINRYKKQFIYSGLLKLLNTFIQFLPALLIAKILKCSNASPITSLSQLSSGVFNEGLLLSVGLFLCLCSKTVVENQYFDKVISMGANIKGTLSTAIYRKSLKLSPSGRSNNTVIYLCMYT